jgi:uncharacterized phiE125 gp8 family phage protein
MRRVITPASVEPLTVDDLRAHARIDHTDLDAQATMALLVAREQCELLLGRACVTATFEEVLHGFGSPILLGPAPLISVTSVKYLDTSGVEQTLSTDVYGVDTVSEPGRVYLKSAQTWPEVQADTPNVVTIRYQAGYALNGGAATTPTPIKLWILLTATSILENPAALSNDPQAQGDRLPRRYHDGLIDQYRVPRPAP